MLHASVYYTGLLIQIRISPTIFCAQCSLFLALGSSDGYQNQLGHALNNITIHMVEVAEQLSQDGDLTLEMEASRRGPCYGIVKEINNYLLLVCCFYNQ